MELALSFQGNLTEEHQIDFYDVAQAMEGFQRTLSFDDTSRSKWRSYNKSTLSQKCRDTCFTARRRQLVNKNFNSSWNF